MVLISTPLHEVTGFALVALPLGAVPNYLQEAVQEAAKHHARILLAEFSFKRAAPPRNLREEVHEFLELAAPQLGSSKLDGPSAGLYKKLAGLAPLEGSPLLETIKTTRTREHFESLLSVNALGCTLKALPRAGRAKHLLTELSPPNFNSGALILPDPCFVDDILLSATDPQVSHGLVLTLAVDLSLTQEPLPQLDNATNLKKRIQSMTFKPEKTIEIDNQPVEEEDLAHVAALPSIDSSLGQLLHCLGSSLLKAPENKLSTTPVLIEPILMEYFEVNTSSEPLVGIASQLDLPWGPVDITMELTPRSIAETLNQPMKIDTRSNDGFYLQYKPALRNAEDEGIAKKGPESAHRLPAVIATAVSQRKGNASTYPQRNLDKYGVSVGDVYAPVDVPLLPELMRAAININSATITGNGNGHSFAPLLPLATFPELLQPLSCGFTNENGTKNNGTGGVSGLQGCTLLWDLVAQEMAPEGESTLLPAVALPASGLSTAIAAQKKSLGNAQESPGGGAAPLLKILLEESGAAPVVCSGAALYLDWSLSTMQASLRPSELLSACKKMNDTVKSRRKGIEKEAEQGDGGIRRSAGKAKVLEGLLAPFSVDQGGSGPGSLSRDESMIMSHAASPPSVAIAVALTDAKMAATPCNASTATGQAAGKRAEPREKRAYDNRDTKRPRREHEEAVPGGLGFFMRLQQGGAPAQNLGEVCDEIPLGTNSDSGLSDLIPPLSTINRVTLKLPPTHTALLAALGQADGTLFASIPATFLPTGVSASDFPALQALSSALLSWKSPCTQSIPQITTNAVGDGTASTTGVKSVIRTLAAAAVLRQTADLVTHHGIRAAAMYLSTSASELPGMLSGGAGVDRVVKDFAAAGERVETGDMEDHPKHKALRQDLVTVNTLDTGAKILVIGDPKSFFTLYPVVHAAGLRPCHLDKESQLVTTLAAAEESATAALLMAVQEACEVADCILVSSKLVFRASNHGLRFLERFRHVIVYCSESAIQERLLQQLQGEEEPNKSPVRSYSITIISVEEHILEPLKLPPPAPAVILKPNRAPATAIDASIKGDHGPSAHLPDAQPHNVSAYQTAQPAPPPATDWPLVISSSSSRPARSRRQLFESLLGLERQGAAIIERPMQHLDLVLSPSAALIIHVDFSNPGQGPGPDFPTFLESIKPLMYRIGRAFTKLYLICEGGTGFRAQILNYMSQLTAVAAGCGLVLQCDVAADPTATSSLVHSVAQSYLGEWTKRRSGMHYVIGDPPTPMESFLGAVPCLNPHSTSVLAGCGLSLQELLSLDSIPSGKIPKVLGLVPTRSMELFVKCSTAGAPLGGGPAVAAAAAAVPTWQPQQQVEGAAFGVQEHAATFAQHEEDVEMNLRVPTRDIHPNANYENKNREIYNHGWGPTEAQPPLSPSWQQRTQPPPTVHPPLAPHQPYAPHNQHQEAAAAAAADPNVWTSTEMDYDQRIDKPAGAAQGMDYNFLETGANVDDDEFMDGSMDSAPAPSWCGPQLGTTTHNRHREPNNNPRLQPHSRAAPATLPQGHGYYSDERIRRANPAMSIGGGVHSRQPELPHHQHPYDNTHIMGPPAPAAAAAAAAGYRHSHQTRDWEENPYPYPTGPLPRGQHQRPEQHPRYAAPGAPTHSSYHFDDYPPYHRQAPHRQHYPGPNIQQQQKYEVDEFGVALDPVSAWEAEGDTLGDQEAVSEYSPWTDNTSNISINPIQQHDVMPNAYGHTTQHRTGTRIPHQRPISNYNYNHNGADYLFPMPGLAPEPQSQPRDSIQAFLNSRPQGFAVPQRRTAAAPTGGARGAPAQRMPTTTKPPNPPRENPAPPPSWEAFSYGAGGAGGAGSGQQQPTRPQQAQHGGGSDETASGLSSWKHPSAAAGGAPVTGGGGGARGYTAAALAAQQQRQGGGWQAPGTGGGTPGSSYIKRKWGGGRGRGSAKKGQKYSTRTRQW